MTLIPETWKLYVFNSFVWGLTLRLTSKNNYQSYSDADPVSAEVNYEDMVDSGPEKNAETKENRKDIEPESSDYSEPIEHQPEVRKRKPSVKWQDEVIQESTIANQPPSAKASKQPTLPAIKTKNSSSQTAPLPFGPSTTTEFLLSEVRPWGQPAQSLPKKGLGMYLARPLLKPQAPQTNASNGTQKKPALSLMVAPSS